MNTSILKNGLLALTLCTATITPVMANINPINTQRTISNEISITIDKDTKDSEFKSIIKTLKQHNIEAKFSGIKRNEKNEITAIKIKLQDDKGNESNTSLSSSAPISSITLGAKNDSLYIVSSNSKNFSFNGTHSLSKHFDFSFDDEEHVMTINGKTFNFDELKEQVKDAFIFENDEDGKRMILKLNNFDFDFDEEHESQSEDTHEQEEKRVWISKKSSQKYRFVDDPNIEKLIMIDGKKSDFKTLDALANTNKLQTVDFLKSDTAMSIYGKKAKDGAIIATTKK
ncbi:MAG: hypothetical protein ACPGU9_04475 [Flavobacteriaceae bacterium]